VPDPFDDLDPAYDPAPVSAQPAAAVPDADPAAPEPVSPAPGGNLPAWAEHLSGDYPVAEAAPTGKAGKRARRKGEQQAPVVHAKDAEYVDWFKDLRGSGRSAEKS